MMKRTSHAQVGGVGWRWAALMLAVVFGGEALAAEGGGPSVLLGRPTDAAVTLNLLSNEEGEARVEYGQASGQLAMRTPAVELKNGAPVEALLTGLAPNTRYYYQAAFRRQGTERFEAGAERSFHTQRAPGSAFVFEIQGDSHPERFTQHSPALYAQTLRAAAADQPDFYMTIGDDFSVDALHLVTPETVEKVYLGQRRTLALVGHSSPVFLVNGNHEQAALCNLNGTADNVAVWAQNCRHKYFPQPAPDGFYTGDAAPVEFIGLLRDYYAWTWGDALFVVLDPYWHSPQPVDNVYGGGQKARDLWAVTLGEAQYRWLRQTLAQSRAKYKFVFAHHVLGTGRGGIECAERFEWGGRNRRGVDEFAARRPGWELPIHQLMAKQGVTIFFQGHDHLFAKQEKDGVIYQTLPEPADPNYAFCNRDAYLSGETLPNSGRVRVTVSSEEVKVEYVRSFLPRDEKDGQRDGAIACSYTIPGTPR